MPLPPGRPAGSWPPVTRGLRVAISWAVVEPQHLQAWEKQGDGGSVRVSQAPSAPPLWLPLVSPRLFWGSLLLKHLDGASWPLGVPANTGMCVPQSGRLQGKWGVRAMVAGVVGGETPGGAFCSPSQWLSAWLVTENRQRRGRRKKATGGGAQVPRPRSCSPDLAGL